MNEDKCVATADSSVFFQGNNISSLNKHSLTASKCYGTYGGSLNVLLR